MLIKRFGFIPSILMILLLPVAEYFVMDWFFYVIMLPDYYLYSMPLAVVLFIIPYIMLKFLFHAVRLRNHAEPELHFTDLPKNKNRITRAK